MQISSEMKDCILNCWNCRHSCQDTLFNYCIERGGEHVEVQHIKIMIDCIEICQICADSMTRNSKMRAAICQVCAEICDKCAQSCEKINDQKMQDCAEFCRDCAKSCRETANS